MSLPPLTKDQRETLYQVICPHCGAGCAARFRSDTKEWVHDQVKGKFGVQQGHTICLANGLRKYYANG